MLLLVEMLLGLHGDQTDERCEDRGIATLRLLYMTSSQMTMALIDGVLTSLSPPSEAENTTTVGS
jgi:hypothetical protein